MAASRMLGVTVTAGIPAYFLLKCDKVNAESIKIHPRDLDIYAEPAVSVMLKEENDEVEISALERHVSMVRQKVWEISDSFKGTRTSIENYATSGKKKTTEFFDLITTDQTFQMKAVAITGATLVGAGLAGRGRRPFRRILFGSALAIAATSICYPTMAVDITLKGYEKIKETAVKQWEAYMSKTPESSPEKSEELSSESKESEIAVSLDPAEIMEDSAPTQPPQTEVTSLEVSEEGGKVIDEVKEEVTESEPAVSESKSFLKSIPFYDKIMKKISPGSSSQRTERTTSDLKTESATNSSERVPDVDTEQETVSAPSMPEVIGDPGMSEAEDKDMYSTRS